MDYQSSNEQKPLKWPYEIHFEKVNRVETEVLVIGGGHAGCCAGIAAARRGSKVAVCDKAPIKRSGCGGAGQDHWNSLFGGPKSPMTVENVIEETMKTVHSLGHRDYIAMKGTWDALLELEKMGLEVRDEDGDFLNADTYDEDTKLLKSYNYDQMVSIKLRGGHYIKPVLYEELRKSGAELFERVMITSLLTEGGKQGGKIAGATGFSMETGEFYVFHAKAVIITTGYVFGCWTYNTELTGGGWGQDPNETGDGMAMAFKAGAQIYDMERGAKAGMSPFSWPRFASGNASNTWFPCSVVDNNGKEIPWEDVNGNEVKTVRDRNRPVEGQPYMGVGSSDKMPRIDTPDLISDLGKRIRDGEYEMPLWADLPDMPKEERRSIFGMMIGNEGKTRYPIFDYFTRWGFNPDKDMLMGTIVDPADKRSGHGWISSRYPESGVMMNEARSSGEIVTDWNLMTNIEGLFCAGVAGGLEGCSFACSSGFYAGNRVAEYVRKNDSSDICEEQVEKERERVYAPVRRYGDPDAYVSWKELWAGSARVMQQCCGTYRTRSTMEAGLFWLESIKQYEMQLTYARNPHELARVMECEDRITNSEIFLMAGIEAEDQEDKDSYYFYQLKDDKIAVTVKEPYYWLKDPYESTYLANYEKRREGEHDEGRGIAYGEAG